MATIIAGYRKFELPGSETDYKLFMEDGAQLCDDEDIALEEIVGGALLFIAKSWSEKSGQKDTVTTSLKEGCDTNRPPSPVGACKQAGWYAPVDPQKSPKGTRVPPYVKGRNDKGIGEYYVECIIVNCVDN